MKLKIGMVGTNFISDDFCDATRQVPGAEVCAIYSRKQETGDVFAQKHGIPCVYTNYDMFLNSGLDAVYIASPNFAHCTQTIKALESGKHVLCEKVMAMNEQEVRSMIDCARKNNMILLEAMRPDFDPAFDIIQKALPRIGKLRRASFEFCQYSSRYDSYRQGVVQNAFNPKIGNAALMDIGVYCIHSLVRLFGMPKAVKALSTKLSNGFDGSGIVLMEYEDMTAEAVYSKISVSVNPSVLHGEDGSILIDYISKPEKLELRLRKSSRDTLDGGEQEKLPFIPADNNMIYELKEFIRLIEAGEVNHKYLQYSLDTIKVIDEARRQTSLHFS